MQQYPKSGKMLFIDIEPMGACKTTTTAAVEKALRLSALGKKVVYVNSSKDPRILGGDIDRAFSSHNSSLRYLSDKVETLSCSKLSLVNYGDYNEVIIDSAIFFDDLVEIVHLLLDRGKNVSVFSLSFDSRHNMLGSVHELIPRADKINHR